MSSAAGAAKQKKVAWKWVPIGSVKPYARNARIHDTAQIEDIAKSIEAFGWQNAILVDGNMEIIAGHGRLEGAKLLSSQGRAGDQVPVVIATDLDPAQVRLLRLADNRIAEKSTWDQELLKVEFSDLAGLLDPGDLELTGFNMDDLGDLLGFSTAGEDDTPPGEFKRADPNAESDYCCPSCGFHWRGKAK